MSLVAKDTGTEERVLISEGVHLAVCIGVWDLGTQHNEIFDRDVHQVLIMWEVPEERIKIEDKELPLAISKRYTLSLNEKSSLRKDLEAWRGKAFPEETIKNGFDLKNILGKACQIQIIHTEKNGKTYANIAGIMSLPKGVKAPEPENPLRFFEIGDEIPEGTPEWIKNIIMQSKEYKEQKGIVEEENDIPPITDF